MNLQMLRQYMRFLSTSVCRVLDVGICASSENEKIDPVDLNYFCFYDKNPNKRPILLIHGLISNNNEWNNIYRKLAFDTGRKVYAVDLRNHGESPWNNRTDVAAMSVDIEHFLNKLNIPKVNFIGHSMGGKVSAYFALKHPERVNSLIVEDMRPNGITEKALNGVKAFLQLLQDAIRAVPENSSEDEAKDAVLEYISKKQIEALFPRDLLLLHFDEGKWQYKANLDELQKAIEDVEKFLTPIYGLYSGPAMFIYGKESPFNVADDKRNILELFPQAQLVPLAGAGHIIHALFPEIFLGKVVKFLNNIK